jgi:hypothetical protein
MIVEALTTLRRQADLVSAEVRITDRRLEKATPGTDPYRALLLRRDILKGKLGELAEGIRRLEGRDPQRGQTATEALPVGAATVGAEAPAGEPGALETGVTHHE